MIKAVIFDMDGVLIDTVEIGQRVRRSLLARHGVHMDALPDPQGEGHRASSLKDLLASVKDHYGVVIDHDTFARQAQTCIRQAMQDQGITAHPGLLAFLEDLKSHGVLCAVASSGLREGVAIKLDTLGIRSYMTVIITGSDVQQHKPHPDTYLHAMQALHLSPDDCVIFEDSLTGIAAGRAAGCKVIGFTQYNPPHKPLQGVVATVENWHEITYDTLVRLSAA